MYCEQDVDNFRQFAFYEKVNKLTQRFYNHFKSVIELEE